MKMRNLIGLLPFTALLLACSKELQAPVEEPSAEPVRQEQTEPAGQHGGADVFHAVIDGQLTDVKTMLSEDMEFLWNEDDEISLFNASTYNREYLFDGMDESEAGDFGEINSPESRNVIFSSKPLDRIYAFYPYMISKNISLSNTGVLTVNVPSEQIYRENSVGPGANLMTAVTEDAESRELTFKNVCGYLKLNLYGDGVIVKSVTLTANGGEKLSGRAQIPLVYGEVPVIAMQSSKTYPYVTISSEEGVELGATAAEATAFWFVVPPVTFSAGFTLTVKGFYGGEFSRSAPVNLTVERNTYYNIAPLEVSINAGSVGVGISGWEQTDGYSGTTS